jgi:hypothetical protein
MRILFYRGIENKEIIIYLIKNSIIIINNKNNKK